MALLTTQPVSLAGLAPTYTGAAAGGDTFQPGDRTFLHVKNGSAASITATVDSIALCNQGVDHNAAVVIPASGERMIGPLAPDRFAGGAGVGAVTYTAVTTVTVAAISS